MKKRSIISVGDTIEFINTKNHEICECIVVNLYKYENFNKLYKHHDKISIGYSDDEVADPNDMIVYYSAENIKKYGVLGIEVIVK